MGYDTTFDGRFACTPALTPEQVRYLRAFSGTRRMRRNAAVTDTYPDPIRAAVGLPVGTDGAYFVGAADETLEHLLAHVGRTTVRTARDIAGQSRTPDVLAYDTAPDGQPGLWCQWAPTDDGAAIAWNGEEKFTAYDHWLRYLIEHFLAPWGVTLDGRVCWTGEDEEDRGTLIVARNRVRVVDADGEDVPEGSAPQPEIGAARPWWRFW